MTGEAGMSGLGGFMCSGGRTPTGTVCRFNCAGSSFGWGKVTCGAGAGTNYGKWAKVADAGCYPNSEDNLYDAPSIEPIGFVAANVQVKFKELDANDAEKPSWDGKKRSMISKFKFKTEGAGLVCSDLASIAAPANGVFCAGALPGKIYTISIAIENKKGLSPYSTALTFTMPCAEPGPGMYTIKVCDEPNLVHTKFAMAATCKFDWYRTVLFTRVRQQNLVQTRKDVHRAAIPTPQSIHPCLVISAPTRRLVQMANRPRS